MLIFLPFACAGFPAFHFVGRLGPSAPPNVSLLISPQTYAATNAQTIGDFAPFQRDKCGWRLRIFRNPSEAKGPPKIEPGK